MSRQVGERNWSQTAIAVVFAVLMVLAIPATAVSAGELTQQETAENPAVGLPVHSEYQTDSLSGVDTAGVLSEYTDTVGSTSDEHKAIKNELRIIQRAVPDSADSTEPKFRKSIKSDKNSTESIQSEFTGSSGLSPGERKVIKQYVRTNETAAVFQPVKYNGREYLLGFASGADGSSSSLDGDSRSINYLERITEFSEVLTKPRLTSRFVNRIFVFERTNNGLQIVPERNQDIIRTVMRTQKALQYSWRDSRFDPGDRSVRGDGSWTVDLHNKMLNGPKATIYFPWEKLTGTIFKSQEDRYLASLQAMTTAGSKYRLIRKKDIDRIKKASDATGSANIALTIAKELEDRKVINVDGRLTDAKLVQETLEEYAEAITKVNYDTVNWASNLAELMLSINERQVYSDRKISQLKRIRAYASSSNQVTLPDGLDKAITELENQNIRNTSQIIETIEQWIKDNGVDLTTITAKAAGNKLATYAATKSSTLALATKSTTGVLLSGAAAVAGKALIGWTIGGILTNRGPTFAALMRADYSLKTYRELNEITNTITDNRGEQFTDGGKLPRSKFANPYISAIYMSEIAISEFYRKDATAIDRSLIEEYGWVVENVLGGEHYMSEKRDSLETYSENVRNDADNIQIPSINQTRELYSDTRQSVSPDVPTPTAPNDGTTGVALDATLQWKTGSQSDITYEVYLEAGDGSPSTKVASTQSGTFEPNLEPGTTYHWRVVALNNSNGLKSTSEIHTFTTVADDAAPTAPYNPTPGNSAGGIAPSATLSWEKSTSDYSPITYTVYLGTSQSPSQYTSTGSTSVDVSGLQQGTTYYWKVVADDGHQTTSSPVWSFTTVDGQEEVTVDNLEFRNEFRDGPLAINGGEISRLEEGYLEYTEKTDEGGADYDLRVINDRGVLVGVEEDNAYDGNSWATDLDMDDGGGSIFRTQGTHSAEVIVYAHNSGDQYKVTKTTNIGVDHDEGSTPEMTFLPVNPQPGEQVTIDVSHFSEDTSGAPIEGYDWYVQNLDTYDVYVDFTDPNQSKVTFTPTDPGELYISISNTGSGYEIDYGDPYIETGIPEPSLSVDNFNVPSTAIAGEGFSASVKLTNSGDATANYIVRFKANGKVHEVEAADEDPNDDRTERGGITLPKGTHDVTAVVIDSHNNKHTFTETVTVEENTKPADPSVTSPIDGADKISRQPTLEWSASDPDGDSLSYAIRLERGDQSPDTTVATGHTSTSFNPNQLDYNTTYSWRVLVTDEHGATTTGPVWQFTTIPKPNQPPVAKLSTNETIKVDEPIQLNATASTDPDGTIVSYDWDVDGDGQFEQSTSSPTTIWSYDEIGTYNITVRVTDDDGATDTNTGTQSSGTATSNTGQIFVEDTTSPATGFALSTPVQVGQNVTLDGSPSQDNTNITKYEWDLNDDGSFEKERSSPIINHTFDSTGNNTVSLRATDTAGNVETTTTGVQVFNASKNASLEAETSVLDSGNNVSVTLQLSNTGDTDSPFILDLNLSQNMSVIDHTDNGAAWNANLTQWLFTSIQPGENRTTSINLSISDELSESQLTARAVTTAGILATEQIGFDSILQSDFTYSPPNPQPGDTVDFTDESTDPDGTIASYAWEFGDGDTSSATNPSHSYSSSGTYDVTLTVTDDDGNTDSTTKTISVATGDPPVANFTYSPSDPQPGDTVDFTDESTDPDGTIASYAWEFGDGDTSSATNPSHSYSSSGTYDVTLTVTDDGGNTDATTKTISVTAGDPPVADFTYSPSDPQPGDTVDFTDGSTDPDGTITSYSWDFDDGDTSSATNPSHTYDSSGIYDVTLTVTDDDGNTDSTTRTISVGTNKSLQAEFSYSPSNPEAGETVQFTDESTHSDGTIATHSWEFGDGGVSADTDPTHTYSSNGTYDVTLTVTDNDGNTDSTTRTVRVGTGHSPQAAFSYSPTSPQVGESIDFTDQSTDLDGTITSYSWEFGDGETSSATNPSHSYSSNGSYDVTLTVTDDDGNTDSTTRTVSVDTEAPPQALFNYFPSNPKVGETVNFTDESTDPDGTITSYSWAFGDGESSTDPSPSHTYSSSGTYDVTLTVTDDDGNTNATTKTISVDTDQSLEARFTYSPANPQTGEAVEFTDESIHPGGTIATHSWEFGDGEGSATPNPSHSYSSSGTYDVTLTVTDYQGNTDSTTKTISVSTQKPPQAAFSYSPPDPQAGEVVEFTDESTDPDGTVSSYAWEFGDGDSSSASDPSHTYSSGGTYDVTLTVTDDNGNTDSTTRTISVGTSESPQAAFSYSPTDPRVGETIEFTDESTDPDGTVTSYSWEFGDGDTSSATNPSHSYSSSGTYDVTLTVTDDDGNTDSTTRTVTVETDKPPQAAFSYSPPDPQAGEAVQFTDESTDPDGAVTSYSWEFGDGGSSTDSDPSHTYSSGGTYDVTLTVTDDDGNTNATTKTIGVGTDESPQAAFSYSPATPRAGETVEFTDESTDSDGSITAYDWAFGDGSSSTGPSPSHTYSSSGTYNVTLTVTDDDGNTDATTRTIETGTAAERGVAVGPEPGDTVNVTLTASVQTQMPNLRIVEEFSPAFADTGVMGMVVDGAPPDYLEPPTAVPDQIKVLVDRKFHGNETIRLNYTVDIPSDAEPGDEYAINGSISSSQGEIPLEETVLTVTAPGPSVVDYADEDGVVRTPGLLDAIEDWRIAEVDTLLLLDVVSAWQSDEPVV